MNILLGIVTAVADKRIKIFVLVISGTLLVLGFEILPIALFLKADPGVILNVSQSFNHIALGVVALFGILVTGVAVDSKVKEAEWIERLREKYPRSLFGTTLEVVTRGQSGKLYLLDRRENNVIRHIGNRTTYHDLEFDDMVIRSLSNQEFDSYDKADRVLTRGIPGT